jgi:hypothetical protein
MCLENGDRPNAGFPRLLSRAAYAQFRRGEMKPGSHRALAEHNGNIWMILPGRTELGASSICRRWGCGRRRPGVGEALALCTCLRRACPAEDPNGPPTTRPRSIPPHSPYLVGAPRGVCSRDGHRNCGSFAGRLDGSDGGRPSLTPVVSDNAYRSHPRPHACAAVPNTARCDGNGNGGFAHGEIHVTAPVARRFVVTNRLLGVLRLLPLARQPSEAWMASRLNRDRSGRLAR